MEFKKPGTYIIEVYERYNNKAFWAFSDDANTLKEARTTLASCRGLELHSRFRIARWKRDKVWYD